MCVQTAVILLVCNPEKSLDPCRDILLSGVYTDFPTNMRRLKRGLYREEPKVEWGTNREELSQNELLFLPPCTYLRYHKHVALCLPFSVPKN